MLFPLATLLQHSALLYDTMRKESTTKEDQFSTMPHHGNIPSHGGSGSKEAHRYNYNQHQQLLRPPGGSPMAPRSSADMLLPAEASLPSASTGDGSSSSSWVVKPGCMMELARLAKVPQPESGLMCPRCQSTETKFCYYNNYSLSQPRHLCRTCRRYWTHGGALRDLPFSSSARRRRGKPSPSNNKHASSSKVVASCASGTGRAASSSSSSSTGATVPGGRVAVATAIMEQVLERPLQLLAPVDMLGEGIAERHRRTSVSSRLWFPGHSSQQDPVHPLGYRHQFGNSRDDDATAIRLDHQLRYLPQSQRQHLSFLGYKNGVISAATTSAISPFSEEAGGTEAGSSFAVARAGQMQAISCRVPGSAVLTTELSSVMMVPDNPPMPSVTEMMGTSPGVGLGLQAEKDLFHFLGSGSWAACGGYGLFTAGNGSSVGGSSCTVAAPGNLWQDTSSGFTSSSCGWSTVL